MGTGQGPPCEPGREGHPGQAYLTLELGCELGWPGCGDGWGGGGIDCGVCTCWPGDGEDSMVRLFWLTWKWRGLSLLASHTLSLPLSPCSHLPGPEDSTYTHSPALSHSLTAHSCLPLMPCFSKTNRHTPHPVDTHTSTW